MFSLLSDNWDGASGSYMGKVWTQNEHLFKLWEVSEPKVVILFMKMYEGILIEHRAEQAEQREKARERKQKAASGGGSSYTHNVQG